MLATAIDTFSLGHTVRAVLAEQVGQTSLAKLCAEVSAAVRPEDREEALRQALPEFVAEQLRLTRTNTRIRSAPEQAKAAAASRAILPAPVQNLPSRSAKVTGIREYWRKALAEWYATDGKGGRAMLASLNREQLQFNITTRETHAQRCTAQAMQLRGLLDLMVRHEVQHVSELPEQVLVEVLTPAAR